MLKFRVDGLDFALDNVVCCLNVLHVAHHFYFVSLLFNGIRKEFQ